MAVIDIRNKTPRTNGIRPLSAIKKIARHHSATATGNWDAFWPHWKNTRGWGTGGYHEIILRNGDVELCYDPEEITNGVANQNTSIYHICVVGNGSFTDAQEKTFDERAKIAMKRFNLQPKDILGHNEFPGTNTSCPGIKMDTVRARLSSPVASTKDDTAYSSPALKDETELNLGSKARRQMIVDQAIAAGYNKVWQTKLDDKSITDADLLALGAGTSVRNSMPKVEDVKAK
ncbi:N-acetylmuramoyl-L-alanine amidase [Sporosarcina sp. Sa2YVA2]|uniref:N-acetylmuramoyl-L-alanine amidase n=1 Tax=Sporosarcina quadrami TaxID=2762234 RepID=A0ABR8U9J2_9BACL|nr:N-acetylmuramoyl-L-alanine amidase [Sporosarcina quadrami]MBD7984394.1 N-acetylmuramoyl-L-alanine amidase [Sporosarcina quadrami]